MGPRRVFALAAQGVVRECQTRSLAAGAVRWFWRVVCDGGQRRQMALYCMILGMTHLVRSGRTE